MCKIPHLTTAYIATHKRKKGLRFVCLCGKYTWLRTNKQEYIEIDESKEIKAIVKELHSLSEDELETLREIKLQHNRDYYRLHLKK